MIYTLLNQISSRKTTLRFDLPRLNTKISAYIHQLQKERGLSSGFISSNGVKFKTQLLKQREVVDKFYSNLNQYLNSMTISKINNKFIEFNHDLTLQYNELKQKRKDILYI